MDFIYDYQLLFSNIMYKPYWKDSGISNQIIILLYNDSMFQIWFPRETC